MGFFSHQTTNFVFPNFFHEFFSVLAVEKENNHFIGPKQVFFLSFGPIKSLFSFSTAKTEKNSRKNWVNKICGLVVGRHEQDMPF